MPLFNCALEILFLTYLHTDPQMPVNIMPLAANGQQRHKNSLMADDDDDEVYDGNRAHRLQQSITITTMMRIIMIIKHTCLQKRIWQLYQTTWPPQLMIKTIMMMVVTTYTHVYDIRQV